MAILGSSKLTRIELFSMALALTGVRANGQGQYFVLYGVKESANSAKGKRSCQMTASSQLLIGGCLKLCG
jgi:hypothetical protein